VFVLDVFRRFVLILLRRRVWLRSGQDNASARGKVRKILRQASTDWRTKIAAVNWLAAVEERSGPRKRF
jgi:hypothetical protein